MRRLSDEGAACKARSPFCACSWLIDNAAKENELVGPFYGIRASTSDNKASNCRDARKVLVLVKDPKMTDAANKLSS
jgi:hypothetical protein